MSRPLRIQFPGAIYYVMNRGIAPQKIFIETGDYEEFLKTIAETHELWGIEVFAYCLMSSHYHICLRTPEGNLSRVMRHVDEGRKVGMYLVKLLCDMTLNEVAGMFGVSSYGVVGWACNWVRVKMDKDKRFRKQVKEIMNRTYKQKI